MSPSRRHPTAFEGSGISRTETISEEARLLGEQSALYFVSTYKRAAYLSLCEMIIELELPPGTRLVETELASRLGVSKTPIREAIGMLESDGVVESTPYRGAWVRWLSVNEMAEQAFLIDAIEVPALPMVVERITPDAVRTAGRIAEQLKAARTRRDGRRFRVLTGDLHRTLFESVGYPRLTKFVGMLIGPVGLRYDRVFMDNFDDIWDAQLALLVGRFEMIRRRDAAGAATLIRDARAHMRAVCTERLSHPLVAPHFRHE